jgi:vancomycin resistance protein YoaR
VNLPRVVLPLKWRLVGAGVGLLGLLAVAFVSAGAAYAGSGVPRGTTVLGVDIGGLSKSVTETKLDRDLSGRTVGPMKLRAGAKVVTLDPREAGLSLDSPATVQAAMRGRLGPLAVLDGLVGDREVRPRIKVDQGRLDSAVGRLNAEIGVQVREGRVVFRGVTPVPVFARDGVGVDPGVAAERIRAEYLSGREFSLPVGTVRARVTDEAVRQAATGPARTAVSAPVTLSAGGVRITVPPQMFARHLQFLPDGTGTLQPRVDGKDLAGVLGNRLKKLQRPARDATYVIKGGTPRLVPSREGKAVDHLRLGVALSPVIIREQPREVMVPLTTARPRLTTEEAGRLGIRQKLSTFTTRHPCCAPRVKNIHTIADILDGYVVKPGETFSLNGIVGRRDRARGFVEAPMILKGRYVNDTGGGISQFATTMFNAVFFGGLQDVQHTPHMFYIARCPAGRESTVSFPQPDFRWRNDSPYGVLIDTSYTGTSLTVTFWSTKRYDIESQSSPKYAITPFETKSDADSDCIPMPGAEGFQIDVWRIFKQNGKIVRRQKFHTTYHPEPLVTCRR